MPSNWAVNETTGQEGAIGGEVGAAITSDELCGTSASGELRIGGDCGACVTGGVQGADEGGGIDELGIGGDCGACVTGGVQGTDAGGGIDCPLCSAREA